MYKIRILLFATISLLMFISSCDHKKNPVANKGSGSESVTVTDADGNTYKTVKIGDQIWTAQDLRTTKYDDGTPIPNVTDSAAWLNLNSGAYSFYKNSTDSVKNKKYGALYNWYAVNTKRLAPSGWHVPTISDWDRLRDYLISHGYNYDESNTGNKIAKSMAAKSDWKSSDVQGTVGNNIDENNKSRFNAYPNGSRYLTDLKDFANIGLHTHYWCSTEYNNDNANSIYITFDSSSVSTHTHPKYYGFTVRLLKD